MKILYLGAAKPNSSVDGVYIKGLRENGVEVIDSFFHGISGLNLLKKVFESIQKNRDVSYIIVGYDSPLILIFARFFSTKPIVYNALCSVYERMIVSRALAPRFSLKALYYWFLDFLAVRMARAVMVETEHQSKYFQKIFFAAKTRIFPSWIGVNEDIFHYNPSIKKFDEFTVLFRGRLLPEAGGDIVVRAAKLLEGRNIKLLMLANGMELPKIQGLIKSLQPKNLELLTEFLPDDKLVELMSRCHVSLGQLSSHERLERTIPHKAYETLALGLPYLTARNPAVMELFQEGKTCIACNPSDPQDLAEKIFWAQENPENLKTIAKSGHELYKNSLTSQKLTEKLLQKINLKIGAL